MSAPPLHNGFSERALDYLRRHAIDPVLATELGVSEPHSGVLAYPGGRRRPLDGSATLQPKGEPLALWWLQGRPQARAHVLLCEGESDALAALTALAGLDGSAPVERPCVASLPGTGCPVATVVQALAGAGAVTLALDGDEAGRACSRRLAEALAGRHEVRAIDPPDGRDLADLLVGGGDLAQLLADAEPAAVAREAPPEALRWQTADELRHATPSAPPWLWEGYIARGELTLIAGLPKSGKSTLTFALVGAIASGDERFLGRRVQAGAVVYVSEEAGGTLRHKLPDSNRVAVLTRDGAHPKPAWSDLIDAATAKARETDAVLVVIDSFAFWAMMARGAEQDSGATQGALAALEAATGAGLAVLLVHHQRKARGEEGTAIRGSGAIAAAADTLVELERVDDALGSTQRQLVALGRHEQTPPVLVVERTAAASWRELGVAEDRESSAVISWREPVLDALPNPAVGDCGMTLDELATALGRERQTLQPAVSKLVSSGDILRTGTGKRGSAFRFCRKVPEGVGEAALSPVGGRAFAPTETDEEEAPTETRDRHVPRGAASCPPDAGDGVTPDVQARAERLFEQYGREPDA